MEVTEINDVSRNIKVLQEEDPKICLPGNLNVDAVKVQTIWSEIAWLAFAKLVVSVAMIVGIKRVPSINDLLVLTRLTL